MQSALLGLFLEAAEDAVLILDRKGCCLEVNQAACNLFGLSQEQLRHRSIANLLTPESWQLRQTLPLQQRLAQLQVVRSDETVRSIEGTVILNQRLQQELWLLRDVTPSDSSNQINDRQQLEQAFLQQQEILNTFMHSAPVGMMVLDRQFRCVRVNPALSEMDGLPIKYYPGKTVWDMMPGIAQQQTAVLEQVIASRQPVLNCEETGELAEYPGVERTWLVSYFPIQGKSLEPIGIGVIVRDITNIKQIQTKLQQVNAELEIQVQQQTAELQQALQFEAMLKRITDKVRDSLDETQILQAAVEELARALETLSCDTGLYDLDLEISTIAYESTQFDVPVAIGTIVQIKQYREVYDQLLAGQYVHVCWLSNGDMVTIRLFNQQFTMLAVPLMDGQEVIGDLWLYRPQERSFESAEIRLVQQVANQCAIALRQSRLYQAAQKQVQELERLNRLKDDFLSTVSHELRTPMSNLKMAVQMLELHLMPLGVLEQSLPIANYFRILCEECDREIGLINDLLDLARLDAETDLHRVTEIDLTIWLPHIAEVFQLRMAEQQQQFTAAIDPMLPHFCTDLFYLERIVVELLTNACKYTPAQESIHLAAHTTSCPEEGTASQRIQIQVSNTGVEIPAAERDRIFDKFYRIPNSDPWKHGGTGLGLALIQKIAHHLGGTIQVESGCDRGKAYTCFTLSLPCWLEQSS